MDLILVRHGQSQFNLDQSGGPDSELTVTGRQQAHMVGGYLADRYHITSFYASTHRRAQQTAEIINLYLRMTIHAQDGLREAEQDYWTQMPHLSSPAQALTAGPVAPELVSPYYFKFQGRVISSLQAIVTKEAEGNILIVSHGGVMGTILRTVMGSHHLSIHSDNTCIHHLHWEDGRWHLVCLNRIEHLLSSGDLVGGTPPQERRRE